MANGYSGGSGVFAPGGVAPTPTICNAYTPHHAVIGDGPRYVSPDCTTVLTDCQMNALVSEIIAAVDLLGYPYNSTRVDNLGQALEDRLTHLLASFDDRVMRSGDTMTGPLMLYGPPANDNEAATKAYVDDATSAQVAHLTGLINQARQDAQDCCDTKVSKSGDLMTGPLSVAGPVSFMDTLQVTGPTTLGTATAATITTTTLQTNGSAQIGGALTLSANPSNPMEAVTKQYVDSLSAGILIQGYAPPHNLPQKLWWDTVTGTLFVDYDDGNSIQWVQACGMCDDGGGGGNFLPITGGTLTGDLILHGSPTVTSPGLQAATKQYVDNMVASGGTFVDAPADGELYGRQDNGWVPISLSLDGGTF